MDITSTIAQEIVSQCKRHSFSVTNSLSTFVLRAQLFAVEKDDRGLAELGPPQIENLVATCVRTLCQIDEPNLETLKMQASLVTIQQTQLHDLRTVKIQHRAKSEHLVDEICRKRNPSECFGDITLYVLHESRLFHTTQEAVHRETIAALESVFPRSLVDHFMTQSEREKKRELEELWKIAFGIRLFNKATRRGGAGIPDVLEDTDRITRTTQDNLAQKWTAIETTCSMYQSVLSYPSLQLQDLALSRLHSELLNRLQMKTYLRELRTSLGGVEENYARVRPVWEAMLTELRELVLGAENATVPKCIIYPKFIALCEHWQHVLAVEQDAKEVSEQLEILLTYERSFQPTLRTTDIEEAAKASAPTMRDPVDRDRVEADITAHHSSSVQYLRELPSSTVTANRVTPELAGFCVVTLMDHGILTEGKVEHEDPLCPGFLLLHANSAYYAFSNERALRSFAADPFKYLSQQLMDLICETPALIYLLALHMYLPRELWLIGSRPDANRKAVPTAHGTTQTGQIEPNKDRSYQWNEWELRRLALKLASLRSKRTHVVQTNASHYRRDGVTQTYPLKEQGTQTMKDATTQPIRVIRAIKGLRGDAAQHLNPLEVVTWKVDVDDMKIKKHDAIHAN